MKTLFTRYAILERDIPADAPVKAKLYHGAYLIETAKGETAVVEKTGLREPCNFEERLILRQVFACNKK